MEEWVLIGQAIAQYNPAGEPLLYVQQGELVLSGNMDTGVQIVRDGQVIFPAVPNRLAIVSGLAQHRFHVDSARRGYDCAMWVQEFNGFQVGDVVLCYRVERRQS